MTTNIKQEIIKAIKNFDIKSLYSLLDDNKSYMDVTKQRFLERLNKQFNQVKYSGYKSFSDVFFGICQNCNKGCEGVTFLSESGYYLDLFFESKDQKSVDDIYVCYNLTNIVDINKKFSLNFWFGEDEKVSFKPTQEYNLIKKSYQALKSDLKQIHEPIHVDELDQWYNNFLYLRTKIDDLGPFICFDFELYTKAYDTIWDIDKIIKIKSKAVEASDALIDYHLAKTEREQLIWIFKNESNHYSITDIKLKDNWQITSTILAKLDKNYIKINISGYQYVLEYFLKLDTLHNEFMEKYKPLPEHYEVSANGMVESSLENYLKLHKVHLDIVEKYGPKF